MGFCSRVDYAGIVVAIDDHGDTGRYVGADRSGGFPTVRGEEQVDRVIFMLSFVAEISIDAGTDGGGAVCAFMLRKDVNFQVHFLRRRDLIEGERRIFFGRVGGGSYREI